MQQPLDRGRVGDEGALWPSIAIQRATANFEVQQRVVVGSDPEVVTDGSDQHWFTSAEAHRLAFPPRLWVDLDQHGRAGVSLRCPEDPQPRSVAAHTGRRRTPTRSRAGDAGRRDRCRVGVTPADRRVVGTADHSGCSD
jgi:hypothetical protein